MITMFSINLVAIVVTFIWYIVSIINSNLDEKNGEEMNFCQSREY